MTRAVINNSLWIFGLMLQCTLLLLVCTRGIARRLPVFTVLLAFYPLRSALLFALYGHLGPTTYHATYNGLSLLDLLLQLLVAIEIAAHLLRAYGKPGLRRSLLFILLPCIAWAGTILDVSMLPANSPIPPDRLQIFDSLVMVLLCILVFLWPAVTLLRRVAIGFAFYGAVNLLATAGRTVAADHRDARAFSRWSYTLTAAWLLVVLCWIFVLKPASESTASSTQ